MRKPNILSRNVSGLYRAHCAPRLYCVRDRLNPDRVAVVTAERIVPVVSEWLSELDAASPMVESLVLALRRDDWPHVHGLSESLAVEVSVAD